MKVRILLALLLALAFCLPAQEVQVLAYNVFLRPGLIGMDDYKAERFAELVEAVRPYDIIGLSEVFDDDRRAELKSRLRNTHPYAIDPPESDDPFLQDGGITFFSRYPVVFSKKTIYKDATGWDECSEKGAIFARLELPNRQTWEVVLSHTQADNENFGIRQKQFNQLHNFIQQYRQNVPLFIIGDLNVIGDTTSEYPDMLVRLGSPKDVYRYLNSDPGYTWNGPENPLTESSSVERLDYILHRAGSEAVGLSRSYINRFPMAHPVGKAKYMSDHYGLVAVITPGSSRQSQSDTVNFVVNLRLTAALTRELQGSVSLRDALGGTSRQAFTLAAGDTVKTLVFARVPAGQLLLTCMSEDRLMHARSEARLAATTLRLPYGQAGYRYRCPAHYAGQPVQITLQGELWYRDKVEAGEKLELNELPEGTFEETIQVGNRRLLRDILLLDGETYMSGESRGTLLFSGIAPVSASEILLCPETQGNTKYARAFVQKGRFYLAEVNPGDYRLLVRENDGARRRLSLLPLSLNNNVSDFDLPAQLTPQENGKNYLLVAAAPLARMIRIAHGEATLPLYQERSDFLTLGKFSWLPLASDTELLLSDYPAGTYRIGLYLADGEKWRLSSTSTLEMKGGIYQIK
jgi:endonuclease/exonuclease/phosphatase family metal-dependent hydrolase